MVQLIEKQVTEAKEDTDRNSMVLEAAEKPVEEDPSFVETVDRNRKAGW